MGAGIPPLTPHRSALEEWRNHARSAAERRYGRAALESHVTNEPRVCTVLTGCCDRTRYARRDQRSPHSCYGQGGVDRRDGSGWMEGWREAVRGRLSKPAVGRRPCGTRPSPRESRRAVPSQWSAHARRVFQAARCAQLTDRQTGDHFKAASSKRLHAALRRHCSVTTPTLAEDGAVQPLSLASRSNAACLDTFHDTTVYESTGHSVALPSTAPPPSIRLSDRQPARRCSRASPMRFSGRSQWNVSGSMCTACRTAEAR